MVQHTTDVLICGAGSAGLSAATWLARYNVPFTLLERRRGPLQTGQADGVQCRTVEVFESFGIADALLREAYHVLEVTFWAPKDGNNGKGKEKEEGEGGEWKERRAGGGGGGGIVRTKVTPDIPAGLSHLPHVILNQARVNGLLIGAMKSAGGPEIDYGYEVKSVEVDEAKAADPEAYAVTAVAERDGVREVFRVKYVLGCDGAHSVVRKSLGIQMVGDSSDTIWGVMDIYPRTDFPDIRKKAIIRSNAGSLIIIPREGGSLVRFYIELSQGVAAKDVMLTDLHEAARRIFKPYAMEFAETTWWSAYAIGQRLADRFTQSGRVFLTGDACHTHSPKAGQGMNVSLQDGYNIGWKLGSALTGQVDPSIIATYVPERQKVAADLIAFDISFARLFKTGDDAPKPKYVSEQFVKSGRYMAGLTARYDDSLIVDHKGSTAHMRDETMAVGMRMPSAQVVRFCDAKPMQLARVLVADGRWRLVVFPGNIRHEHTIPRLQKLAEFLGGPHGLAARLTLSGADIDSFIEPIVILQGNRHAIEQEQLPAYFHPVTGKWGMRDLHKIYMDDKANDDSCGYAYGKLGVHTFQGAVVIVRPDQYVAAVYNWYGLGDMQAIETFFNGFKRTGGPNLPIRTAERL